MFDVGASELLLIIIVAIVVIGPKDLPLALRTAGRWIGKVRRVSGHFRAGIENMIREAELEEMEKKWREQNEAVMQAHPQAPGEGDVSAPDSAPEPSIVPASAEARAAAKPAPQAAPETAAAEPQPQLPLPPP